MKTNDLKKGDRILLRNGWYATIADNKRGNIRLATVEGDYTETGSVYSHDIKFYISPAGSATSIEHTPEQIKLRKEISRYGF